MWYWCQGRQIVQWNKTESPKSDWCIYMIQEAVRATGGKEGLFNNGSGTIDFPHQKKWCENSTKNTKLKSRWIKYLNTKQNFKPVRRKCGQIYYRP